MMKLTLKQLRNYCQTKRKIRPPQLQYAAPDNKNTIIVGFKQFWVFSYFLKNSLHKHNMQVFTIIKGLVEVKSWNTKARTSQTSLCLLSEAVIYVTMLIFQQFMHELVKKHLFSLSSSTVSFLTYILVIDWKNKLCGKILEGWKIRKSFQTSKLLHVAFS